MALGTGLRLRELLGLIVEDVRTDGRQVRRRVVLDFSRPGKPSDNAFIEAFNGSLRRECLSQHWFLSLEEAQPSLDAWKVDYNNVRPHSALGNRAPARSGRGGYFVPDRDRLQNSPA